MGRVSLVGGPYLSQGCSNVIFLLSLGALHRQSAHICRFWLIKAGVWQTVQSEDVAELLKILSCIVHDSCG